MSKIIVIGGGAAGLICAITAAKNHNEVIVIERNNGCGKKILVTGNGKCNYWNSNQDNKHYHSSNLEVLHEIITKENKDKVLSFFDSIGIVPKIMNGYYYPYSSLAASIQYALIKEAEVSGVKFIYDMIVDKIEKKDSSFIINKSITCDKVVLATGSKACPKTGSDGIGYDVAKSLGHTITPVLPALVQLVGDECYFKAWNGIRTQAKVSLYIDNIFIKEEEGELQLTDYGISGICVFNISRYVPISLKEKKTVRVKINFAPFYEGDNDSFIEWLENRNNKMKNRKLYELLEGFLNYKLVDVLLKNNHIDKNTAWNKLSKQEKQNIVKSILSFKLDIVGTNSFDKAQVCSGGVSLSEINPKTMESKLVDNLYIIGEILDVDGDCGGYNLGFAWMSGMIAGMGVNND